MCQRRYPGFKLYVIELIQHVIFHYMPHQTYAAIWIHLIWATKNREALIAKSVKIPLYAYLRQIAEELHGHIDFINGVDDHVHLLVSLHPSTSISQLVKNLKGRSWQWMREQQLIETYFAWQDGYAAISVSPSNVPKVRNYIRNQEKHHQQTSFAEELVTLKNITIVP